MSEEIAAPEWTDVTVRLDALKPWTHNPRVMTKRGAKRLLESWKMLGQFKPIVIGPAGEVYDGHQRLAALMTVYGAGYEVAARQSDRPLTEDERRALVINANETIGQWTDEFWTWPETESYLDDETLSAWRGNAANLAALLEANRGSSGPEDGTDEFGLLVFFPTEDDRREVYEAMKAQGLRARYYGAA